MELKDVIDSWLFEIGVKLSSTYIGGDYALFAWHDGDAYLMWINNDGAYVRGTSEWLSVSDPEFFDKLEIRLKQVLLHKPTDLSRPLFFHKPSTWR